MIKDRQDDKKNRFVKRPTTKPIPETIPNWDKPTYCVGIKDKKPISEVIVTITKELTTVLIDEDMSCGELVFKFSRYLELIWIPKSTEMPINKTAKATEIIFKLPTNIVINPSVIVKPTIIVNNSSKTNIKLLNAKYNITKTKINESNFCTKTKHWSSIKGRKRKKYR